MEVTALTFPKAASNFSLILTEQFTGSWTGSEHPKLKFKEVVKY